MYLFKTDVRCLLYARHTLVGMRDTKANKTIMPIYTNLQSTGGIDIRQANKYVIKTVDKH